MHLKCLKRLSKFYLHSLPDQGAPLSVLKGCPTLFHEGTLNEFGNLLKRYHSNHLCTSASSYSCISVCAVQLTSIQDLLALKR